MIEKGNIEFEDFNTGQFLLYIPLCHSCMFADIIVDMYPFILQHCGQWHLLPVVLVKRLSSLAM